MIIKANRRISTVTIFFLLSHIPSVAQVGKSVVVGSMTQRPSALMVLNPPNADQGFLVPQLTTANRLAMRPNSPLEDGLLIFDFTEKAFYFWKNNSWVKGLDSESPQVLSYDPFSNRIRFGNSNEVDLSGLREIPSVTGNASKFLTNDGTSVQWGTSAAPGNQDLTLSGKILSLSNDLTPVDLSGISWTGSNITDGSLTAVDLANGGVQPIKLSAGALNTVLTTNGVGSVIWAAPAPSPDAQDLTLSGNTLSLTNDGTAVNLNNLTAGGQLTGVLNNLAVVPNSISNGQIQNSSVTVNKLKAAGVLDANKFYSTDATGIPQLELKANIISGLAASGDLSGTYPAPSVAKLQGNAVSAGPLTIADAGKLLLWNGSQWIPQIVTGVSPVSQYTMIDPSEFTNLRRGDRKDKDNIIMFDDNSTYVTTINKDEGPQIIAPLQLPDGAKLEQVTLYYMDRETRNIVFDVFRKTPTGANQSVFNTWNSTGSSGSIQTSSQVPIVGNEIIDNNSYSYRIVINLDQSNTINDSNDATLRVYAVKVRYLL